MATQHPLELILARNLIATIALAAFLIDADGTLLFFNTSAGDLIGRRFEQVGRATAPEWMSEIGPFDDLGELIEVDSLPMTQALREGLPANGHFRVNLGGEATEIEASGLPLTGKQGFAGAIIAVWKKANG